MERVIYITGKIFTGIFTNRLANISPIQRIIYQFTYHPYLCVGISLLVIGFAVGIIKRIIRS